MELLLQTRMNEMDELNYDNFHDIEEMKMSHFIL